MVSTLSSATPTKSNQTSEEQWMFQRGTLAFVPHPTYNSGTERSSKDSKDTFPRWPCLLYNRWSTAILQSGLFSQKDFHKSLPIISCKKKSKLEDLAADKVPARVAVKMKARVVVHFLGCNEWSVANIDDLTKYTKETCHQSLRQFNRFNQKCDIGSNDDNSKSSRSTRSSNSKKNKAEEEEMKWRENWMLAMKEASIVIEAEESMDPSILLEEISKKNVETISSAHKRKRQSFEVGNKPSSSSLTNSAKRGKKSEVIITQDVKAQPEREEKMELTQEFYDDWRAGGNTQKLTQTQSQFHATSTQKR